MVKKGLFNFSIVCRPGTESIIVNDGTLFSFRSPHVTSLEKRSQFSDEITFQLCNDPHLNNELI